MNYISDNRPPRDLQNQAMSIGSAFDAYVKNYLHEALFGKDNDPKYAFDNIFTSQVEIQNRDWAKTHGKYVFDQYKSSGALADLMLELHKAQGKIRMEFDVRGVVNGYREGVETEIAGVTLLGKPDLSFVTAEGIHVVFDWKCNGYVGKYKTSPTPGYIRLRGANNTHYDKHKDAFVVEEDGLKINIATTLDMVKIDWASQLAIYSWLCGSPVGSDFIVGIDQIVCSYNSGGLPSIKVAEHRTKISPTFQKKFFSQICEIWEIVQSNWFWRDMSLEDSIERCKLLDGRLFEVPQTEAEEWLMNLSKKRVY